jgi:GT2 family glycosyltransferase
VTGADGALEQSARAFPTMSTGLFGRTSVLARWLPRSSWVRRELLASPDAGALDVDWVSGACIVIPDAQWQAVGGFDAGYFMYWEDADWCFRASRMDLRVRYEPGLAVIHQQGSSASSRPIASIVAFHRSAWRYRRKQGSDTWPMRVVVALGLTARTGFKIGATMVRRGT